MHGEPRAVGDQVVEVGHGVVEVETESVVIQHLDSDGREISGFARYEILRTLDREKHVGVFGSHVGRQHALVGVGKIAGGDGVAVGPLGIVAQVECPSLGVLGGFPVRRDPRHGGDRLGVVAGQPFEERKHDVEVLQAVDDVRIEIRRLGKIAKVQGLRAVAAVDGGLARATAGEKHRR